MMYSKLLVRLLIFLILMRTISASVVEHAIIDDEGLFHFLVALNGSSQSLANEYFAEDNNISSLDLKGNELHGHLPHINGSMPKLKYLNLANNNFSGKISATWSYLSSIELLDFSSNSYLSGRIPMQLCSVPILNYSGTNLTCGDDVDHQPCKSSSCSSSPVLASRSSSKVQRTIIISCICVSLIILLFGALFIVFQYRQHDVFVDVDGNILNSIFIAMTMWIIYSTILINLFILPILMRTTEAAAGSVEQEIKDDEGLFYFLVALNDSSQSLANEYLVADDNVSSLLLSYKGLSGTLSPQINKLKLLEMLDLKGNELHGHLPHINRSMPKLKYLNLANNNFSGQIPATWSYLSSIKLLDFSSNSYLSGRIPAQRCSVPILKLYLCFFDPIVLASRSSSRVQSTIIISCICVSLIMLFGALFIVYRYRQHDVFMDVDGVLKSQISHGDGQLRRFSLQEIQHATNNFAEGNIVGRGISGKVFKGILCDNTKVVVKRLLDFNSSIGEAEFLGEIRLISVPCHQNLLWLIGYCISPSERILVYPFMQNLSLEYHLRGTN